MARNQRDEENEDVSGRSVTISTDVIVTFDNTLGGSAHGPDATISVSTIGKWFKVRDEGTDYYIPMWS